MNRVQGGGLTLLDLICTAQGRRRLRSDGPADMRIPVEYQTRLSTSQQASVEKVVNTAVRVIQKFVQVRVQAAAGSA